MCMRKRHDVCLEMHEACSAAWMAMWAVPRLIPTGDVVTYWVGRTKYKP